MSRQPPPAHDRDARSRRPWPWALVDVVALAASGSVAGLVAILLALAFAQAGREALASLAFACGIGTLLASGIVAILATLALLALTGGPRATAGGP